MHCNQWLRIEFHEAEVLSEVVLLRQRGSVFVQLAAAGVPFDRPWLVAACLSQPEHGPGVGVHSPARSQNAREVSEWLAARDVAQQVLA